MLDSDSEGSDNDAGDIGHLAGASGVQGRGAGSHAASAKVQQGSSANHWADNTPPHAHEEIPPLLWHQYYVGEAHCMAVEGPNSEVPAKGFGPTTDASCSFGPPTSLSHLLQLPEILVPPARRSSTEPVVDYSKSIIMTGDDYIKAMEEKAAQKESIEKDKELRKREAKVNKGRRVEVKMQKEA
jgi:hypothetical protein